MLNTMLIIPFSDERKGNDEICLATYLTGEYLMKPPRIHLSSSFSTVHAAGSSFC